MSGRTRKPVVLFINHWSTHLGGAEYSLIDLCSQVCHIAETHCITSEPGALTDRLSEKDISCHIVPSTPSLVRIKREHLIRSFIKSIPALMGFLRYLTGVRHLICIIKPDCIHANVPKSHITLLLLRLTGIRIRSIIHFREIFPHNSCAIHLYNVLYHLSGRPRIIAISDAVRTALPPGMQHNAIVIHNGIAVHSHPPHRPTHAPPVRFLYLGRIVPWKGCDFLLTTFSHFIAEHGKKAGRLTLIGDTSYWEENYRTALHKRITSSETADLINLQPHTDDIQSAFATHDVLCMPSRNEPFGRSAAEAHAAAMPVIAWDCGGLREIVIHLKTGHLVPVDDRDAFKNAMSFYLKHMVQIGETGTNGWKHVQMHFNRETQVPRILRELLTQNVPES